MQEFKINDELSIECWTTKTRAGTREHALLKKNNEEVEHGSDFWSNRPWYRFTYENAISECLRKSDLFTKEQIKNIIDGLAKKDLERVSGMFSTLSAVCKMGEVLCNEQKEKNDWKSRMLKAGLPGLEIPEDWNNLSEDEKEARLDKVITTIRGEE